MTVKSEKEIREQLEICRKRLKDIDVKEHYGKWLLLEGELEALKWD